MATTALYKNRLIGESRPSLEVNSLANDTVEFTLSNANISLANALRRIMIAEVPILAIDLVTIYENTSVLNDELLSHRFGLVPIDSTRIEDFNFKHECSCQTYCAKCCIEYIIDVTCDEVDTRTVNHTDIQLADPGDDSMPRPITIMQDDEPMHIILAKLRNKQRIHARLLAFKGIGKIHAKWIPVATAVYKMERQIRINTIVENSMSKADKAKLIKDLPEDVLHLEEDYIGLGSDRLVIGENCDISRYDLYAGVAHDAGFAGLLRIEEDETKFHFTVESTGALPPIRIVEAALTKVISKADMLIAAVEATLAPKKAAAKDTSYSIYEFH